MNYFLEGVYIIIDYFFKKGKQKYPYYILFIFSSDIDRV